MASPLLALPDAPRRLTHSPLVSVVIETEQNQRDDAEGNAA